MTDGLPLERHPRFRRLYDYLSAKAPPGLLPGRQHIDPVEIADLLPYVTLIEVVNQAEGPLRFHVRLAGTWVVVQHGREITGHFIDEVIAGPQAPAVVAKLQEVVATRRPNHRRTTVAAREREHVAYERIAFPLARDGVTVDMIMVVFMREDQPPGSAAPREG
jgi:hypothetical protein